MLTNLAGMICIGTGYKVFQMVLAVPWGPPGPPHVNFKHVNVNF